MPTTDAGALARHDLAEGRQVAAERVRILVVNLLDVHLTEETLAVDFLFHNDVSDSPITLILRSGS